MVPQLLLLTEVPFSARDYQRFGIERLQRRFEVTVLDCTAWMQPRLWHERSDIAFRFPGYVSITDSATYRDAVRSRRGAIAIDNLGPSPDSPRARAELRAAGGLRTIVQNGLVPMPHVPFSKRVSYFVSRNTPRTMARRLIRRAQGMRPRDPLPDIALIGGLAGLAQTDARGATHRIPAHSFDYDIYLQGAHEQARVPTPYAVFLDEDMVFHPDFAYVGTHPVVSKQRYFRSMNAFFAEIESAMSMPVVIAAHPRSRYELHPDVWEGRTVIRGASAQLVQHASRVLCHASTSISFAVLWRRPLTLVTTHELRRSLYQDHMAYLAKILRAPIEDADERTTYATRAAIPRVDVAAYQSYEDDYLKVPGSADEPLWDIFADYVERHWSGPSAASAG